MIPEQFVQSCTEFLEVNHPRSLYLYKAKGSLDGSGSWPGVCVFIVINHDITGQSHLPMGP